MRRVHVVLALMSLGLAGAASGAGEASFGARDPAAISCRLFTAMYAGAPTGTERQFYNWAQGYFAGRSEGGAEQRGLAADGDARQRAFRRLAEFCGKNPDAPFHDAVVELWVGRP